jgi:hypothetical protein
MVVKTEQGPIILNTISRGLSLNVAVILIEISAFSQIDYAAGLVQDSLQRIVLVVMK